MKEIPNLDHYARYCDNRTITEDGRITGASFKIRKRDMEQGGYLSGNWIESLSLDTRAHEIRYCQDLYIKIMKSTDDAQIAVLNVGYTKQHVAQESLDNRSLSFKHVPSTQIPSHAGIFNMNVNDFEIFDLIAESVQEEYFF